MRHPELDGRQRNEQLVWELEERGVLRDRAVAAAFRAVLRHHFLPDRPLDEVYEDAAVMTKIGEHGLPVSSSSQPAIMAIMLQQLHPGPAQRVLEVGAGTGYNAALLGRIVGPAGRVVTLDIDRDLCDLARANLLRAGIDNVEVVQTDGAGGWPAGAPYHRIIVTAAAGDLSPAWLEQLVDGGRLVLPLALTEFAQQCTALIRRGRAFVSRELTTCGFMPLRGALAESQPDRPDDLGPWLRDDGRPAGCSVADDDLRSGFAAWLAFTHEDSIRARLRPEDTPVFGLRDERGAALVVAGHGDHPVMVFGDGAAAARRLADAYRAWTRERPQLERLRVEARPAGEELTVADAVRVFHRPRFTFLVSME